MTGPRIPFPDEVNESVPLSGGQVSSFNIPHPDEVNIPDPSDVEERPGPIKSMYNLGRRVAAIAGFGSAQDRLDVIKAIKKNTEASPENAMVGDKVIDDFKNFFSNVTWKGTRDALKGAASQVVDDPVGMITSLPMGLIHMFVANPLNVVTGSDVTQNELVQQSTEQGADEIKSLLGTAAGVLVGGAASKALSEVALSRTAASFGMDRTIAKAALSGNIEPALAGADTRAMVAGIQRTPSALGAIGKRIVDGTLEGAAFGASQSAVASAGKEDLAAQVILNGVVFAPIGAATEFMRLKAVDPVESVIRSAAKDVAYTRQVQASVDRSFDEALNTAAGVLESDNIIAGIARGNLKTNPKAVTVLRGVEPSRLTKFPDDLEVTTRPREDGLVDVLITNAKNEVFAGREIPQNPRGKLVERKKDKNGNLVPQVGDRVVSATPDGDFVSGTVVTFEGQGGKEKTIRLDAKGKPVESESQMKELWVRRDVMKDKDGKEIPFGLLQTKEHERFDPEKWYVDPDQVQKGVDFGKIYKVDRATSNERNFLHSYFKVNGKLPEIGTVTRTRELAGYNGQDFFVQSIDAEKGKAILTSPRNGALGGIEVPLEDVRLREATVHQYEPQEFYDGVYQNIRESLGKKPFAAVVAEAANKFGIKDDAVRPLMLELGRRYKEELLKGPANSKVPAWLRESMIEQGKDPGRLLNDVELARADTKEVVNLDPTLTDEEKANFLKHGTPKRVQDKIIEVDRSIMEHEQKLTTNIQDLHEKLVRAANSNGMYIEDVGTGIQLRNIETGELMPFSGHTPSEALKFINDSGQAAGVALDGASPVPTDQFGGFNAAPASLAEPGTAQTLTQIVGTSRKGFTDKVRAKFQQLEVAHPWAVGMRGWVAGLDEIFNTNILPAYVRAQDASLKTEARVKKLYARFEPVMRELAHAFPTADEMTLASRAMETLSIAEMELKFFGDRGLSEGEKLNGKFIADNKLDETKVLKFRTEIENLKSKVFAHQERELGNVEQLRKHQPNAEALADFEKSVKAARAEIAAKYQPEFDALAKKYNLTKVERELYEKFRALASGNLSEASIYGAVRYGRALKEPLVHGLSQAEFFDKYHFNPAQRQAIASAQRAYDELGDEFKIPQFRRINGYMNHIKRLGDEARPSDIMKFSSHLDNPGVARFMSDLYRTGENDAVFNHDIVEAMRGYIRGGVKAQDLFPEIHGQLIGGKAHGGVKEQFEIELNKLPENVRDVAYRRLREYIESLAGRMPLADAVVREGVARTFEKMGIDLTSKPIDVGSKTASLLSLINASFTGGKVFQGLRDVTDVGSKYFIKFGRERAQNFLKIAVRDMDIQGLMDDGIVRSVDKNTFVQPVESSIYGKLGGMKSRTEDLLFKATLQDKVFERAQAAAYYESKSLAREVLGKVLDKKMTLEDAVTALSLRQFEDNVTTEVGRLLEAHGSEAAAKFYAKQSVRSTIGLFGHGEQPSGFNTKAGRIIGQYGIYPIETRRFVMDIATRGTPKEIAAALGRYALSQGALYTAGTALGFNMARWIQTPASMVFTGGPLVQFGGTVGQMVGSIGGDENAQRIAYNKFKQAFPSLHDPRSMFVPGSYATYDLIKGFQLLQNGEAKGVAGAFGIPLAKDANFTETGVLSAPWLLEQFGKDLWAKNGGQ